MLILCDSRSDLGGGGGGGVVVDRVGRREGGGGGGQVTVGAPGPPGPRAGPVHLQGDRLEHRCTGETLKS